MQSRSRRDAHAGGLDNAQQTCLSPSHPTRPHAALATGKRAENVAIVGSFAPARSHMAAAPAGMYSCARGGKVLRDRGSPCLAGSAREHGVAAVVPANAFP